MVKGTVGTVLDIDHVRIEDPNEDDEGEILVKGPNVMLGYYKNEEATRDAMTEDGYFRTGDYGKLTEDNILSITGRKKNLIILSNGKNVYPEEIENQLISVPGIDTVVVYEGQSKRGMEHNAIVAEIYPDYDYIEKNGVTDLKAYFKPFIDEYNRDAVSYKKIQLFKPHFKHYEADYMEKTIRRAHEHGIVVNMFYSDDPEEARRYLEMGCDVILTNDYLRVSKAAEGIERYLMR